MPRPVLIDTDAGVDDALAIMLALRSPEISVEAITTVAGNVEVEKCSRNVEYILELVRPRKQPIVGQGARKPLKRKLVTAPEVHGQDGLGNTMSDGSPDKKKRVETADVILKTCARFGRRLTIISLGPLTNLALAFQKDATLLGRVHAIVSMGGAFFVPGNTGPVSEFNYFVDPDSARMVLNSGLPITVVPLDVTEQFVLTRKDLLHRTKSSPGIISRFILDMMDHYMKYHKQTDGIDGCYVHDPITVAAVIEPSVLQTGSFGVDIETEGEFSRGMTTICKPEAGKQRNVRVATGLQTRRFSDLFHRRLWM